MPSTRSTRRTLRRATDDESGHDDEPGHDDDSGDDDDRGHENAPAHNDDEPPTGRLVEEETGGDLLSQALASQVPSALRGLTALFGMGRGVSPAQ
jgi:hypothetical protein